MCVCAFVSLPQAASCPTLLDSSKCLSEASSSDRKWLRLRHAHTKLLELKLFQDASVRIYIYFPQRGGFFFKPYSSQSATRGRTMRLSRSAASCRLTWATEREREREGQMRDAVCCIVGNSGLQFLPVSHQPAARHQF